MKCIPIFIGMDDQFDIAIDRKSCKELINLKNHILKFSIPSGSPESNIFEQKGASYHIPYNVLTHIGIDALSNQFQTVADNVSESTEASEQASESEDCKVRSTTTPMDEFMELMELTRLADVRMNFSEKQTFKIIPHIQQLETIEPEQNLFDELVDLTGTDKIPDNIGVSVSEDKVYRDIVHSGIELDLDIYQKTPERFIRPDLFHKIIAKSSDIFMKYLDIGSSDNADIIMNGKLVSYAVILGKPDVQAVTSAKYGQCYKDSYHIRFPGLRTTKAFKKFLIDMLKKIASGLFGEYADIINTPIASIFDELSASNPAMILGSCKAGGTIPHEFRYLYKFELDVNLGMAMIGLSHEFDIDPMSEHKTKYAIKDPRTHASKKIDVVVKGRPRYNLCYETSLCYEDPKGLIKKRNFDVKSEYKSDIKEYDIMRPVDERGRRLINEDDITSVKESVDSLISKDSEALNIYKLLGILNKERAVEYESWRRVIFMLARKGPEYYPLAVWFSMRSPEQFNKGGIKMVKNLWTDAVNNKDHENSETMTVRALSAWAKIDNPIEYAKIQTDSTYHILNDRVFEKSGRLNETDIADILKTMIPNKFVTDLPKRTTSKVKTWYEFVYPEDEKNSYIKGEVYKWRNIIYPDTLDEYVTKKLPKYIGEYMQYLDSRIESSLANMKDANTESAAEKISKKQQFYSEMKSNLVKTKNSLGKVGFINSIITRSAQAFHKRGFEEVLDNGEKVENYIGVLNGVLQLHPLKLIQSFHEIPISRCCGASYKPYDPDDPYVKELEDAIKFLFCNKKGEIDEESYEFVMMYLASSLNGQKKKPIFFLWLGEGGNGKSFLLEMHIQAMGMVVKNGYGNKINVGFFTGRGRDNDGGPDTEKMTMKHARYTYCSESDPGAELIMRKIKEFTGGETISGNDKNEKQDQFRINSVFTFCTNHDPRIKGLDYGTIRRILAFRFKRIMKHDPDPNNPLESKIDERFIEKLIYSAPHKQAYLSIITKYYEILMTKYGGNVNLVPKKNIDAETKEYISEQNFYSKYVYEKFAFIGKFVPTTRIAVKPIPIIDIIQDFKKWYISTIGQDVPNNEDIRKSLMQTSIGKFILEGFGKRKFLYEHAKIADNEDFNLEKYINDAKEAANEELNGEINESVKAELFNNSEIVELTEPTEPVAEHAEPAEIRDIKEVEQEFEKEIENIERLDNIIEIQEIKEDNIAALKQAIVSIEGQEFIDDLDWS